MASGLLWQRFSSWQLVSCGSFLPRHIDPDFPVDFFVFDNPVVANVWVGNFTNIFTYRGVCPLSGRMWHYVRDWFLPHGSFIFNTSHVPMLSTMCLHAEWRCSFPLVVYIRDIYHRSCHSHIRVLFQRLDHFCGCFVHLLFCQCRIYYHSRVLLSFGH